MLTGIRKFTQGWIAGGLLSVLVVAFAVWGIQDVFRSTPKNAVASGEGIQIGAGEFRQAFDRALEDLRSQNNGRAITAQDAAANGIDGQVLQRLVSQKALDQLAAKMGLGASDAMIAKTIRSDEAFRSQLTNSFDRRTYDSVLAQNGLSSAMYEEQLRSGLRRQQIALAVAAGEHAPKSYAALLYAYETEKRIVSVAAIESKLVPKPPEPSEADLQAFYKQNAPRLATPEYRKLTLVLAKPDVFEAKTQVPEDKIKELYEFKKAKLGGEEKRSFIEISAPSQDVANEAARRLAAGEDAQKIAASLKLQAIPFTQIPKSQVPDPAIAEAVFALKPDQTTGPIKGRLAWATAKVTEITSGAAPSLEKMHDELRAELAKDEAQQALNDAVTRFNDDRSGGKSLEDAAKSAGLLVLARDKVDAQGHDGQGAAIQGLAEDAQLLKAAFATTANEATDFMPAATGGFVLARVDAITPPGVRPFAEVKPMLTLAWKAQHTGEAMRKIADALTTAVKGGKSFEDAANALHLPLVARSQLLDRQAAMKGPTPQLGGMIFAAPEGEIVSAPAPSGDTLLIARIEHVQRQDPGLNPQLMGQAQKAADNFLITDLLTTVQNAAVKNAKVRTNQKLIKQTLGLTDDSAEGASGR